MPQGNRPGARPDATLAHVAYGLYAASVLVGVTAIAGLLLCYIARRDVRATWIEGHYRWLIRGFWLYFLINLLGMALVFIGVGWLVLGLAMMWWIYRIAIGWLRLYRGEAIPDPASFI
ncbi:MAG: hypothetical protein EXQ87_04620 [Alphaproteobacteria bacterium]|nr:hypothetical protein [Alphaproteobacteria bacterium]